MNDPNDFDQQLERTLGLEREKVAREQRDEQEHEAEFRQRRVLLDRDVREVLERIVLPRLEQLGRHLKGCGVPSVDPPFGHCYCVMRSEAGRHIRISVGVNPEGRDTLQFESEITVEDKAEYYNSKRFPAEELENQAQAMDQWVRDEVTRCAAKCVHLLKE